MARIRTIKPEFWQDEKLAPLPDRDRLVFLGLICMADDAGRLLDNPKVIDAFIFPESDGTSRESLATLSRIGRIRRGMTASGQRVIQVVNWERHQRVDHPNLKAALPEIATEDVAPLDDTESRESVANQSRTPREPGASDSRLIPTTYDRRPTTDVVPRRASRARLPPGTVPDPGGAPAPRAPSWSARLADLLREHANGIAVGRWARVLKPFVQRDGPDTVLERLRVFLEIGRRFDDTGRYLDPPGPVTLLRPERFRDTYADWQPATRRGPRESAA